MNTKIAENKDNHPMQPIKKKQEIKKLSKDEVLKNIDKLKKNYLTLNFKELILKLKNHQKLDRHRKL